MQDQTTSLNDPAVSETRIPVAGRAEIVAVARSIGVLGGSAGEVPRIMAALCDPDVQPKQLKTLLQTEPALCARVLKVANSALYGQVKLVGSLDRALMVLGLDAVRGIAAAGCLDRSWARGKSSLMDIELLVRHSQATAAAADSLAHARFPDLAPDAFIAGLLHNLGTVVQMHIDPAGVEAVLTARRAGDSRDLAVLEREFVSVGHEECGAIVFEEWQLPPVLVATARYHHCPLRAPEPEQRFSALINISSAIALSSAGSLALETASMRPNAEVLSTLGLDEQELIDLTMTLADRIAVLTQALQR